MKKSIVAIQGTSNLGKTETLNILIDLLSCVIYKYEITKYNEFTNDRRSVFTIGGKKVCVCTAGDNEKEASDNVDFIKEKKADIVFTACHNTNATNRSILKTFAEQNGYKFDVVYKKNDKKESRQLATKLFLQVIRLDKELTE